MKERGYNKTEAEWISIIKPGILEIDSVGMMGGRDTGAFSFRAFSPLFCILWALSSLTYTKYNLMFGSSVQKNAHL